ncbi:helix-turn-helix domain-containing protein [Micromonospora sp. R42106]|nr:MULTISPECIES: helix-turn-helix domain-containing protein [Micromonospora]MCK1810210.1 helix-turn-helix domain-containing protein [Micromonospora sp. R42106]MCK1835533.1 helix-turn-helix domain-containing protein [Micromonospora sp. R42003]MCK1847464.1 helix-turn-helix domain-containing protein [Micromonospora sp. R42004]MCM1015307.1 helix-turn-helix domain-containing protein [Micromonospora sp. XM-20-01]
MRLVPQNQPADAIDRQEGDNVIRLSPKVFMSTEELAELLDVDPSTIRRWRTLHPLQGPPFIQISDRVVKYATADVERWLSARRVYPQAA